ncbi:MAG: hypothetical protein FWC72_05245 [Oscillospiraceae bacterium]|nr:hypothetical protein [Oscillospiraceae bacterium]
MRKLLVSVVAIVLVLAVGGAASGISFPGVNSLAELSSWATDIARVEVVSETRTQETVTHQFRVIEVFQGAAQPEDIVEVRQSIPPRPWRDYVAQLAQGDDLVVFIRVYDGLPARFINPFQGIYQFPDRNESSLTLETDLNIASPYDFPVTIGDLLQLAEANFGHDPDLLGRNLGNVTGDGEPSRRVWPLIPAIVIPAGAVITIAIKKRRK